MKWHARWSVTTGLALSIGLIAAPGRADVSRVDVTSRTDVLGGRSYGPAGPYEWIEGRAHFTLDPDNPRNHLITDIGLARRNDRGRVEFWANLVVLRPKDPSRASGVVVFDVSNRGR